MLPCHLQSPGTSYGCLSSGLIRQKQSQQSRKDDQGTSNVHWNSCCQVGIQRDDRSLTTYMSIYSGANNRTCQNTEKTGSHGCQTVPGASILGREYFGWNGVQYTIHNLLESDISLNCQGRCRQRTPTLLQKTYPQFQPRRSLELLAVVLAKRKPPVSPVFRRGSLSNVTIEEAGTTRPLRWQGCLFSLRTVALRSSQPKAPLAHRVRSGWLAMGFQWIVRTVSVKDRESEQTLRYVTYKLPSPKCAPRLVRLRHKTYMNFVYKNIFIDLQVRQETVVQSWC